MNNGLTPASSKRRGASRRFAILERWARRKALQIDVVQNVPKHVQTEFIVSLLEAYTTGYQDAVDECAAEVNAVLKEASDG